MSKFTIAVRKFIADENGVTALEYGMIAALIAVAIAATVTDLGEAIDGAFIKVKNAINGTPATP